MLEITLVSFATFFATVGPIDTAVVFATLTTQYDLAQRKNLARRATLVAAIILYCFALGGQTLLSYLGVSLAALRIAGGILLMLIGIDLVFARDSGGTTATDSEKEQARHSSDIAVFPVATPLIAGPGTIGAAILLFSNNEGSGRVAVLAALTAVLILTYWLLNAAARIEKIFGATGMHVVSRVMGLILTALAVQFMIDGAREIGLLGAAGG